MIISPNDDKKKAEKLFSGILTKPISSIDDKLLQEMVSLEEKAMKAELDLQKKEPTIVMTIEKAFKAGLRNSKKISEEEKKELRKIFSETMLRNIQTAPRAEYTNFKEGKGILFYGMMNDRAIGVLDGIIAFKKSVDKNYPGLSDLIIKASFLALTTAIDVYVSPVASMTIRASGIADIAQDFLKTDNLEKARKDLHGAMKKIEQDKKLAEILSQAKKSYHIAEVCGVPSRNLYAAGFSKGMVNAIIQDGAKIPVFKDLVQNVVKYEEDVIPCDEKQISDNLSAIKDVIIFNLKQNGVAEDYILRFSEKMDKQLVGVEKILQGSLDPEKTFLEKILIQQEGAQKLLKITNPLIKHSAQGRNNPNELSRQVMKIVSGEVVERISGPAGDVVKSLKDSELKAILGKEVKDSLRTEVMVERTEKALQDIKGQSLGK